MGTRFDDFARFRTIFEATKAHSSMGSGGEGMNRGYGAQRLASSQMDNGHVAVRRLRFHGNPTLLGTSWTSKAFSSIQNLDFGTDVAKT